MNKNREQGTGNREQLTEEERHEAATEEAATVGCPSLGIPKLPGGFDGTEPAGSQGGGAVPAAHVSEEKQKKLEDSYLSMRGRLEKISDIALAADAKCGVSGRIGENWMTCSKAIGEIRRLCKQSFVEEIVLDYEWLAKIMTRDHFEPECLAKAIEAEAAKKLAGNQNANIRKSDESTRKVLEHLREDSPDSPDSRSEAEIQREEARQKRKIHWTCYPTKVDLCVMGRTEQNGKVYEVRVNKRKVADVQDTYGQCKVNGKTVLTVSFTGGAWMLKRILTEGMQALVNYKAKKNRDSRRNYKRRDDAAKQQAHDNKGEAAKEVK